VKGAPFWQAPAFFADIGMSLKVLTGTHSGILISGLGNEGYGFIQLDHVKHAKKEESPRPGSSSSFSTSSYSGSSSQHFTSFIT